MFFNWTRPTNVPYPHVWLKFTAKDVFTDDLVGYRIEDLPEDRFDEAIKFMAKGFLSDSPMPKLQNGVNDPDYVEDITRIWKGIVKQKICHVCFKEGSKEIVGLKMNYVSSKGDASFLNDSLKSAKFIHNMRVIAILRSHGNLNVFEKYGVDKYLASFGLYVPKQFSGRKIGQKLLEASKYMARPIGIKLSHMFFSSDLSNKVADNVGYLVDVELSYKEMQQIDSRLNFENIESSKGTLKTWVFDKN